MRGEGKRKEESLNSHAPPGYVNLITPIWCGCTSCGGRRGQFTCAACALCMRIVYTCCPKSRFASSGNLIPHNCALNAQTKRRRRFATLCDAASDGKGCCAEHNSKLSSSCVINEAHFRETSLRAPGIKIQIVIN